MLTEDFPREADAVERELATLRAHLAPATPRWLAVGRVKPAEASRAGDSAPPRPAPERQQVVIELRAGALGDQGATRQLRAELEDGAHVPAETFRRVAGDW